MKNLKMRDINFNTRINNVYKDSNVSVKQFVKRFIEKNEMQEKGLSRKSQEIVIMRLAEILIDSME